MAENEKYLLLKKEEVPNKNPKYKPYKNYRVGGVLRGVEVSVEVVPIENTRGGYSSLDIVFSTKKEARLVRESFIGKDDGRTLWSYHALDIDEDGQEWKCQVKGRERSDRDILKMLFDQLDLGNSMSASSNGEGAHEDDLPY